MNILCKYNIFKFILIFIYSILFTFSSSAQAQKSGKIKTVVIDAGHGGKDPGASGKYSREKDIALAVALKTGGYIKKNFPNIKVIYTRKTDVFIDLYKRGDIANKAEADVFISIHCNANHSSKIYGAETYVLGVEEKREKRNIDVAMKENAAILLEDNTHDKYDGFNPNSPEDYISLTLFPSANLDQSLRLSQLIQKQFTERVGRKDRSVMQAGFLVLWKTYMPSVLVELGYLSNPKEEKFLRSKEGQTYMASAIYRAFKEYKLEYEKENNAYEYRKQMLEDNDVAVKNNTASKNDNVSKVDNKKALFKVQFYTSPRKIATNDSRFKNLNNIEYYEHNAMYKYTSGGFVTLDKANHHKDNIRKAGFNDAFVVAFFDGKRITIKEAKAINNN